MNAERVTPIIDQYDIAEAVLEKKRRIEEEKILFYKPCCRGHNNQCPKLPCPESKHSNFHMSDKRNRIVFGGNRSSKSTTLCMEMILSSCFKFHPFRKTPNPFPGNFRIYNTDFGIIEKLVIPKLIEWIPKSSLLKDGKTKMEAWENSYDQKFHILKLKGGSTIDLLSYDQDSSKSESVELDGVWADEQMPERIYSATMARLISRRGFFMMGVTPLYDLTWAMKFLDSVDDNTEVFHFSIYDNPYNTAQSIKEFEASIPEHEKEARINGQFMELQGLVYKEIRKDIHMLGNDYPKTAYPVVFALDPHPRKASVMVWAYVTPQDDVVVFDELEIHGTAREIVTAIRAKEANHGARTVLRVIDPAAKAQGSDIAFETDTLQEFERCGMGFTLADNSDAGYNAVHELLRFDPSLPMSNYNRPKLFFTKNAPKTWFGMTHLMWDEWTFKKALKDEKERIRDYKKDFPDCVRYVAAMRPTFRSLTRMGKIPSGNYKAAANWASSNRLRDHEEFRKMVFNR